MKRSELLHGSRDCLDFRCERGDDDGLSPDIFIITRGIMTNICKHSGKPYGFPFKTSITPSIDIIRKYMLRQCPDCGGWFPWFGGW